MHERVKLLIGKNSPSDQAAKITLVCNLVMTSLFAVANRVSLIKYVYSVTKIDNNHLWARLKLLPLL